MKIRMLMPMGGIKVQHNIGDEIEVSAKEAESLIDAGFAEPLKKPAKARTAVLRTAAEKTATG